MKFLNHRIVKFTCLFVALSMGASAFGDEGTEPIKAMSTILWQQEDVQIAFSLQNQTSKPLPIDAPEINMSPITMIHPSGEKKTLLTIVEWLKPLPPVPPNTILEKRFDPLERINWGRNYEAGLYRFSVSAYIGETPFISNEVLIYRDESAPKISPYDNSVDSPEFAQQLIKSGSYTQFQEDMRAQQIAATEGTKEFFFAHPYTLALFVDGKKALKLGAFLTNTKTESLDLSALGSEENYLEVKTPIERQILRSPIDYDYSGESVIKMGQTKKWVANVSDLLLKSGSTRSGKYQVSWIVKGKKVADFSFVRPELKSAAQ